MQKNHLYLLEECNSMWDIIPISRAINYLHENPPPHAFQYSYQEQQECTTPVLEEREAYKTVIPFEVGSQEWCFIILILYKSSRPRCLYDDTDPGLYLLLSDQGPDYVISSFLYFPQENARGVKYCSIATKNSN